MDQPHDSMALDTAACGSGSLLDDERVEHPLIHIAKLMWRENAANVEDVADEIVLECLIAMREGRWDIRDDRFAGFIHMMVERRATDLLRSGQRRQTRERSHFRDLVESCGFRKL